jgi:hypothetical protein
MKERLAVACAIAESIPPPPATGVDGPPAVSTTALGDEHVKDLITALRTIGQANVELIDEITETRVKMMSTAKLIKMFGVFVLALTVLSTYTAFEVLKGFKRNLTVVGNLSGTVKVLNKNTLATLEAVRANAVAISAKTEADLEVISDLSPSDLNARNAAFNAKKTALQAESEVGAPKQRARAQEQLRHLNSKSGYD